MLLLPGTLVDPLRIEIIAPAPACEPVAPPIAAALPAHALMLARSHRRREPLPTLCASTSGHRRQRPPPRP
jgi:hypothetical protein